MAMTMRGREVAVFNEAYTRKPSVAGSASARISKYCSTFSLSVAEACAMESSGVGKHKATAPIADKNSASHAP